MDNFKELEILKSGALSVGLMLFCYNLNVFETPGRNPLKGWIGICAYLQV